MLQIHDMNDVWMKRMAASQEEKAKDTVLINGIGFVAACVSRPISDSDS